MKTSIKLVLIYLGMQILAMLAVTPFAMIYAYIKYGSIDQATTISLSPTMLGGFLLMGIYLWKNGYLKNDGNKFAVHSTSFLFYSIAAGISAIFLVDFIMSNLSFLPDLMKDTFNLIQSGWLGILCIAVLGPILEELLFRGAITKVLLQKYSPAKAIFFSGLIFGIVHLNPVQIVGGILFGLLFAWLYYKSGSLIPGILLHIINNSLSVFLSLNYPDVEYTSQLMNGPLYIACLLLSAAVLLFSLRAVNRYKYPEKTLDV